MNPEMMGLYPRDDECNFRLQGCLKCPIYRHCYLPAKWADMQRLEEEQKKFEKIFQNEFNSMLEKEEERMVGRTLKELQEEEKRRKEQIFKICDDLKYEKEEERMVGRTLKELQEKFLKNFFRQDLFP